MIDLFAEHPNSLMEVLTLKKSCLQPVIIGFLGKILHVLQLFLGVMFNLEYFLFKELLF